MPHMARGRVRWMRVAGRLLLAGIPASARRRFIAAAGFPSPLDRRHLGDISVFFCRLPSAMLRAQGPGGPVPPWQRFTMRRELASSTGLIRCSIAAAGRCATILHGHARGGGWVGLCMPPGAPWTFNGGALSARGMAVGLGSASRGVALVSERFVLRGMHMPAIARCPAMLFIGKA